MFRNTGWAAFLASVTLSIVLGSAPAVAGSRAIFACFSPGNAAVIGKLGANDPSVRQGFESGECLALPAGVPLNDVERHGTLWRFRVFGARPHLYAADWAMGLQPAAGPAPTGFEQYLPVTASLLSFGRAYTRCYDESTKLAKRIEDHEKRWKNYEAWRQRHISEKSTPKVTIYVSDTGPRLVAEAQALRREADKWHQRCSRVAAIQADDDFVVFIRTALLA